jgi:hypothetical protein
MMLIVLIGFSLSLQPCAAAGQETVLFPFDDYSVPFNKGLLLELVPGRKSRVNQGTGHFADTGVLCNQTSNRMGKSR